LLKIKTGYIQTDEGEVNTKYKSNKKTKYANLCVNIYGWLICKLTVPQWTIESKTNMQYIFKIICILQSPTLWTHRCSAFTKDLPVIKIALLIFLVFCVLRLCIFTFWVPVGISAYKRWLVRLYLQLFVRRLMSY
jgi:hypothetical protein